MKVLKSAQPAGDDNSILAHLLKVSDHNTRRETCLLFRNDAIFINVLPKVNLKPAFIHFKPHHLRLRCCLCERFPAVCRLVTLIITLTIPVMQKADAFKGVFYFLSPMMKCGRSRGWVRVSPSVRHNTAHAARAHVQRMMKVIASSCILSQVFLM